MTCLLTLVLHARLHAKIMSIFYVCFLMIIFFLNYSIKSKWVLCLFYYRVRFGCFAPVLLMAFVRICLNFFIPVVGECWIVLRESLTKIADRSIFFSSVFLFFCCRCHILGTFLTVEFRTCIPGLLSVLISPNPFCNCYFICFVGGGGWWGGGGAEHWNHRWISICIFSVL